MSNVAKNVFPAKTYPVDRKMALADAANSDELGEFISKFASLQGILTAQFNARHGTLDISYDLHEIDFDEIFRYMDAHHVSVRDNFFDRIKYSAWRFSDHNQKEILAAPLHCCNKSPK